MIQVIEDYNGGLEAFKIEEVVHPDSREQHSEKLRQVMKSPTVMNRLDDRVDYLEEKMDKLANNFSQLALFMKQEKERSEPGETINHHSKSCPFFNRVGH